MKSTTKQNEHLEKAKELLLRFICTKRSLQEVVVEALEEAKEKGRQEVIEEIEKFIEDNTHKNGYVMTLIELRKKLKEIKK